MRGASRMLVLDRATGRLADERFENLPGLLQPGDLLILNDSRVLRARLFATRAGLETQANSPRPAGVIEVLLTEEIDSRSDSDPTFQTRDVGHPPLWRALVAEVVEAGEFGERTLRFEAVEDFYGALDRIGAMPLPPYIHRDQRAQQDTVEDRERYQTVSSRQPGSAAAPTAGLHFTPQVLAALAARGVEIQSLTLHVGLGTFQPVRVERLEDIR